MQHLLFEGADCAETNYGEECHVTLNLETAASSLFARCAANKILYIWTIE
jgi:hypothetical protein